MKKLLELVRISFLKFALVPLLAPWVIAAIVHLLLGESLRWSSFTLSAFCVSVFLLAFSPLSFLGWVQATLRFNRDWILRLPLKRRELLATNVLLGISYLVINLVAVWFTAWFNWWSRGDVESLPTAFADWNLLLDIAFFAPVLLFGFFTSIAYMKVQPQGFSKNKLGHLLAAAAWFFLWCFLISNNKGLWANLFFLLIPLMLYVCGNYAQGLALDRRRRKLFTSLTLGYVTLPVLVIFVVTFLKYPQLEQADKMGFMVDEARLYTSRLSQAELRKLMHSEHAHESFLELKTIYEDRYGKLSEADFVSMIQNVPYKGMSNFLAAWQQRDLSARGFQNFILKLDDVAGDNLASEKLISKNLVLRHTPAEVELLLRAKNLNIRWVGLKWAAYIHNPEIADLLLSRPELFEKSPKSYAVTKRALAAYANKSRAVASVDELCKLNMQDAQPELSSEASKNLDACIRQWAKETKSVEENYEAIENADWSDVEHLKDEDKALLDKLMKSAASKRAT